MLSILLIKNIDLLDSINNIIKTSSLAYYTKYGTKININNTVVLAKKINHELTNMRIGYINDTYYISYYIANLIKVIVSILSLEYKYLDNIKELTCYTCYNNNEIFNCANNFIYNIDCNRFQIYYDNYIEFFIKHIPFIVVIDKDSKEHLISNSIFSLYNTDSNNIDDIIIEISYYYNSVIEKSLKLDFSDNPYINVYGRDGFNEKFFNVFIDLQIIKR